MGKDLSAMQEMQEMWVRYQGQEDALEEEIVAHSSILAWESHGQRNLVGYSPWGCRELNMAEQLSSSSAYLETRKIYVYILHERKTIPSRFPCSLLCQYYESGSDVCTAESWP